MGGGGGKGQRSRKNKKPAKCSEGEAGKRERLEWRQTARRPVRAEAPPPRWEECSRQREKNNEKQQRTKKPKETHSSSRFCLPESMMHLCLASGSVPAPRGPRVGGAVPVSVQAGDPHVVTLETSPRCRKTKVRLQAEFKTNHIPSGIKPVLAVLRRNLSPCPLLVRLLVALMMMMSRGPNLGAQQDAVLMQTKKSLCPPPCFFPSQISEQAGLGSTLFRKTRRERDLPRPIWDLRWRWGC